MFDLLSDRLSQHLEQIVRERNPFFSSQGHFYVREYLRQELGQWGKVESHFFPFQGKVYENLILDLPNNSQKPLILIGDHYDTVPGSLGADDNATGLAVLLELARFFCSSLLVMVRVELREKIRLPVRPLSLIIFLV